MPVWTFTYYLIVVSCFLDIDADFKMQLEDLAPLLLEPSRIVVKTINGNSVTGKDLLEYFKVWYIYHKNVMICVNFVKAFRVGAYVAGSSFKKLNGSKCYKFILTYIMLVCHMAWTGNSQASV